MNRTPAGNNMEGLTNPMESLDSSTRPAWVTPALERLSLKDALGTKGGTADFPGAGGTTS